MAVCSRLFYFLFAKDQSQNIFQALKKSVHIKYNAFSILHLFFIFWLSFLELFGLTTVSWFLLESDITHTVSVHLGEVLNPEATLYIYLIGQRGETSKVFLRPEEPLEREKTYKFTLALTVDIGRVRAKISSLRFLWCNSWWGCSLRANFWVSNYQLRETSLIVDKDNCFNLLQNFI